MSLWIWLLVFGSLFVVSLAVGLAVAAILGNLAREVTNVFDLEPWASSPLTRAQDASAEEHSGAVTRHAGSRLA